MDRMVTKIEELSGKRKLIYLNEEPAFALYAAEIRKFNIQEQNRISEEVLELIEQEILSKRAVKRAMYLLKAKDYTVKELTEKLQKDYYSDKALQCALEYVKRFGYLDDIRYADTYIRFKGMQKSRKQIEMFLQKKGIDKEIISKVCDEYYAQNENSELEQVLEQMRKKMTAKHMDSYEEKMKLMGYFYRKGYQTDNIKKAFDIVSAECNGEISDD